MCLQNKLNEARQPWENRVTKHKARTESGVDVGDGLVHGHVYQAPAQAVVGEGKQQALKQLVTLVQALYTHIRKHRHTHSVN